ncbi:MAG: aminotransferase class IV [Fimbriimonadales bacterium]|nr:aminotransferase class IV [Fimbriimonadales bacterium]
MGERFHSSAGAPTPLPRDAPEQGGSATMRMMVNWNGRISPLEEACLPVFDHAYLYGDGLFEGIRIYNRNIFKLDPHLERLYDGVRHLDIRGMIPYEELKERILETAEAAGAENAYIRVSVSRGTGIGLNPENINQTPNVMIAIRAWRSTHPNSTRRGCGW